MIDAKLIAGIVRVAEKAVLALVAVLTLGAVGNELLAVVERRVIELADLLLLFLYAEVLSMVAVFYASRSLRFVYPIFIAITAIARLIVLQGKDMDPKNILYEAAAILILVLGVVLLVRVERMHELTGESEEE